MRSRQGVHDIHQPKSCFLTIIIFYPYTILYHILILTIISSAMSKKLKDESGDEVVTSGDTTPPQCSAMSKELKDESGDAEETTETYISKQSQKRKDYLHWDDYFMATALLSAKRSKDPVTQVGACIVDTHNRIISIGYNGFPRNCSDDVFPWARKRESSDNKNLYVVHAEANAILNCKMGTLDGTRLYTTLFPCNECAKLIIQSGIKIIYYLSDKYGHRQIYQASKRMLDAAGVEYHWYSPKERMIILNFDAE